MDGVHNVNNQDSALYTQLVRGRSKIRQRKPVSSGNHPHQFYFNLIRVGVFSVIDHRFTIPLKHHEFLSTDFGQIDQSQPLTEAVHVGIYRDPLNNIVRVAQYDIRGFSGNAR